MILLSGFGHFGLIVLVQMATSFVQIDAIWTEMSSAAISELNGELKSFIKQEIVSELAENWKFKILEQLKAELKYEMKDILLKMLEEERQNNGDHGNNKPYKPTNKSHQSSCEGLKKEMRSIIRTEIQREIANLKHPRNYVTRKYCARTVPNERDKKTNNDIQTIGNLNRNADINIKKTSSKLGHARASSKCFSHIKTSSGQDLINTKHALSDDWIRTKARVARAAEGISFSVFLDHELTHLYPDVTVKFNKVLLNEGNGYNIHTGVFTVPVSGVYLFGFQYVTNNGQTNCRLVVDDIHQVGAKAHEEQSGNMVIIRVNAGQSVWIQTYTQSDTEIYGSGFYRETIFSGVLLYN